MLRAITKDLQENYPTHETQRAHVYELIKRVITIENPQKLKHNVTDILDLIQLLYSDEPRITYKLQATVQMMLADSNSKLATIRLRYLSKCIAGFNPMLMQKVNAFFASTLQISESLISTEPKKLGQQAGCLVKIHQDSQDENPIIYHVKTHQEFSSKSHPVFLATPSEGSGLADFKELFMYKVLELIGYGPKTLLIPTTETEIEEGILIATQDLGYTKRPETRKKTFQMFQDLSSKLTDIGVSAIDEQTKIDIVIIDILSRSFLLDDVMINQGNFGAVKSMSLLFKPEPPPISIKWKILDFMPPKVRDRSRDDYSYSKHYPGSADIFHSFKLGNVSHTYDTEDTGIICEILQEENSRLFWPKAIKRLTEGTPKKASIEKALEEAFHFIERFTEKNQALLQIKPTRLAKRIKDLVAYKTKCLENYLELASKIDLYCAEQKSIQPKETIIQEGGGVVPQ